MHFEEFPSMKLAVSSFQSDPSLPKLPSIRAVVMHASLVAGTIDRRPLLGLVPCDFLSSMLLCVSCSTTANVSQDGTQSPSEGVDKWLRQRAIR
ncbi:hypothetical protein E4U17_006696 [Claviceps sp. LM77 group G4]|nr:hypothetical protein E4U17_006696 [Claviceps sp. LM77 group G4]KAG6080078.1 hypothetical protein E4U33_007920 [Claviceps sp. LM78 group G4]